MDNESQVKERRPTPVPDGSVAAVAVRRSGYGDAYALVPSTPRNLLADEGSYYTVTNPVPDTTVACGVIAAYVATTPLFHIANTAPQGGRSISLDTLKLRVTIAPASGINAIYTIDVDGSTRLSTAPTGGADRTINNVNPALPNDAEAKVFAFTGGTVLTIMAAASARTIAHGAIAHSIPIAQDELVLAFGQDMVGSSPATAVTRRIATPPPVVIPPQCSASIHIYFVSNAATGLSAEYELGFWQR